MVVAVSGRRRAYLFTALVLWIGVNAWCLQWALGLGISQRVYLRDLMFSEIVSDSGLPNTVEGVDALLMNGFKVDASTDAYSDYLHPNSLRALTDKAKVHAQGDHLLALAITAQLGQPDGSVCGLEALGDTVFDTRRGQGCCSDYSKSWLFYANYLGMTVREVSLFNHTTVEFFNRATGRWQWLDPFNRVEIVDAKDQPLSLLEIRNASRFEALKFKRLPSANQQFAVDSYAGYAPAQMSTMLWRRGTNFLEVEAWDRVLRAWGLSKSVRQMVTLMAGV